MLLGNRAITTKLTVIIATQQRNVDLREMRCARRSFTFFLRVEWYLWRTMIQELKRIYLLAVFNSSVQALQFAGNERSTFV